MKPNNLIYRSIASKITGKEFEKFYSSMYYMRAIAEYYNGEPYTGRKPSNKYIKDWYLGLTGESEPETHKYNLWYLREIVKFYDPQQSGLNENQCLSFIDDQLEPPSPVEFDSISLTATPDVLSYADGDTATLTAQLMNGQEEAHLSGKSVSFDVIDGNGDVISNIGSDDTDSDGIATVTYTSTGIGDIRIQASVTNGSSTYTDTKDVEDCLGYFTKNNNPFSSDLVVDGDYYSTGSSSVSKPIVSLDTPISLPSDFEISYTGKNIQQAGGWNLLMVGASANCNQYNMGMISGTGAFFRKGRDSCTFTYLLNNTGVYSVNTDVNVVYQYKNNQHILKINDNTYTCSDASFSMDYFFGIGIGAGSRMKNIKVKPL